MTAAAAMNNPDRRRSRHAVDALMAQTHVGVSVLEGSGYVVAAANSVILASWGKRLEEVQDIALFDAMPELEGQGIRELLEGVIATGRPYMTDELAVDHMHGGKLETRYFNFSYTPLYEDGETPSGILVLATDITREVVGRRELEAERQRLQRLFLQAPAMIAILRGPDHVFELANDMYLQTVGDRDIIGKPVAKALPEVVAQGFVELLDGVYHTGKPFIGSEVQLSVDRDGDGQLETALLNFIYQPTFDGDGNVDGVFVHAVDVTDQVTARRASEEITRQIETVFESMPDGVLIADHSGVTRVNLVAARMLGATDPSELMTDIGAFIGRFNVRLVGSDRPLETKNSGLNRALRGENPHYEAVMTNRETGRDAIYRIAAAPITDNSGDVVSAVAIMTDITEQKELERQKDDFIGIATHELKTPVTSMKTYAQIMERRFRNAGDADSEATMKRIIVQINKLTNLISDLLDVTKIEGGRLQIQPADHYFDQIIADVVEQMQLTTTSHAISVTGATGRGVHVDRERLEQVLMNLISNAIKYSPAAEDIEVSLTTDGDDVVVCVRDHGIGIPAEKQAQVFERFFRVSGPGMESFPGLGLGLYISAEIVRRLGGRIWVESDGETGSSFCFRLPAGSPVA